MLVYVALLHQGSDSEGSDSVLHVCKFMVLLSDDKVYYCILHMVYAGIKMLLAGIALLHDILTLWLLFLVDILIQCVLCRFVVLMSDDKDYFFILYMVYVGINVLLAGIALLHWPGAEQLELLNDPEGYQVILHSMIWVVGQ